MLQLAVQVRRSDTLQPGSQADAEMQRLRVQCHAVVARRLPEVLAALAADSGGALLTSAVATVLQRAPAQLQWQHMQQQGQQQCSYEAAGPDGVLYHIDVLDGTVLLDGRPPSRLPRDVLEQPLYRRMFGGCNFEVAVTSDGVYKTLRPIQGRHYDFWFAGSEAAGSNAAQLVIEELDDASGQRLQLLDVGADGRCGAWGCQLPVRLRALYSHWLCRCGAASQLRMLVFAASNVLAAPACGQGMQVLTRALCTCCVLQCRDRRVIILRPPSFQQHAVHFVIECSDAAPGKASALSCWRVPHHLRSAPWQQLLDQHHGQLTERLVLPQQLPLIGVLSRLEAAACIHVFAPRNSDSSSGDSNSKGSSSSSPAWRLLFELSRFGLEFELQRDGLVASRDHSGFSLSSCQRLVWQAPAGSAADAVTAAAGGTCYTLPGFTQYLLLERQEQPGSSSSSSSAPVVVPGGPGEQIVLVPAGEVLLQSGGVSVAVSNEADARLQVRTAAAAPACVVHACRCAWLHMRLAAAVTVALERPGAALH